jgi:hypothetical protein
MLGAEDVNRGPRGDSDDFVPRCVGCGVEIGLVEQHHRRHAALPRHREVTLDASKVEVAVEADHHERGVDVGDDDLLCHRAPSSTAGEGAAPRKHGDDPAVGVGGGLGLHRDPVADHRCADGCAEHALGDADADVAILEAHVAVFPHRARDPAEREVASRVGTAELGDLAGESLVRSESFEA